MGGIFEVKCIENKYYERSVTIGEVYTATRYGLNYWLVDDRYNFITLPSHLFEVCKDIEDTE